MSIAAERKNSVARRLPIGAEVSGAGVHYRVWAPKAQRVSVVYDDNRPAMALEAEPDGYFSGLDKSAQARTRYRFQIDDDKSLYPDPASRYQPEGVFGASEVVDARTFRWSDRDWRGPAPLGQVLYEMHIGTLTQAGTWAGAIEKLDFLKTLGITCLEVMPVAEFPGRFNWGYDGVDQFAPTRAYGTPDDMRRFIDAAHARGIAVILDVVYNHFGPAGNFVHVFSGKYFSEHKNDWGTSLNFDGPGSRPVRDFFISNAKYWIDEFHLDGFRFDATQAILDNSPEHILAEIARAARMAAGERSIYLVAENEPQDSVIVRSPDKRGYGFDSLWNDDFHHSAMVAITGRNEAYYTDHAGHPQEFLSALKWGYLFQGQIYRWQKNRRGKPALDVPPTAFVHFIQNHDQIANYGDGRRLQNLTSPGLLRAITALLLLGPQTPMIFQGQEFGCSSNFNFFSDHDDELNKLVSEGRRKEIKQFPCFGDPRLLEQIPDPGDPETFQRCKIRWEEIEDIGHARILALHTDLLKLRRELPFFARSLKRGQIDGAVLDGHVFCARLFGENDDDLLMIVNLWNDVILHSVPEPLMAPPIDKRWEILWSSEDPKYGGLGVMPLETRGESWRLAGENWRIPGYSLTLLCPVPAGDES
ncbi:MAG: malto-oligosyltrehalose trehalohydrolase [Burkholderiales bacterium]|nr:malto-oligosyltrehalose trehalohydrolase [Phycisphaerae bacterium]